MSTQYYVSNMILKPTSEPLPGEYQAYEQLEAQPRCQTFDLAVVQARQLLKHYQFNNALIIVEEAGNGHRVVATVSRHGQVFLNKIR